MIIIMCAVTFSEQRTYYHTHTYIDARKRKLYYKGKKNKNPLTHLMKRNEEDKITRSSAPRNYNLHLRRKISHSVMATRSMEYFAALLWHYIICMKVGKERQRRTQPSHTKRNKKKKS